MMRCALFTAAALLWAVAASGQDFKQSGRKAVQLAPKDWTITESRGDLNKDGIADLLIMAIPHDESKAYFDDNGVWIDDNRPWVAVYWGSDAGIYRLQKVGRHCFEGDFSGKAVHYSAEITSRGTIRLLAAHKADGDSKSLVEIYRWQKGDFYRIGRSEEMYDRATGVTVLESYNYSILRHQHLEYRGDADTDPDRVEDWEDLPGDQLVPMR